MINVQLKNRDQAYCVVLSQRIVTMGPGQIRHVVEADVYGHSRETGQLVYINKGIAILNPLDRFDVRLGALKAVGNAVQFYSRDERKEILKQIESWFE